MDRVSFTCPCCGMTTYHPDDVREGYCGACHDWTGGFDLATALEAESARMARAMGWPDATSGDDGTPA